MLDLKEVVSLEQAELEVEQLLDLNRVMPLKRSRLKLPIETLVEAVQYGYLSLDFKENTAVQKLQEPITDNGGSVVLSQMTIKLRVSTETLNKAVSSLKQGASQSALMLKYASIFTGEAEGIISKLCIADRDVIDSFCSLFL